MSSTFDSSPDDEAMQLLEAFHSYERAFARWSQSLMGSEEATPARMRLLGVLNCKGPTIMCGLREHLNVTARQVTNLVDALESEGLVRRRPHETDRRATVVEITRKGAKAAAESWGPLQREMAGPYRDLSSKDRQELLRLMRVLCEAVHRRGERGDSA